MALDPANPGLPEPPINTEFLASHKKRSAAMERSATASEKAVIVAAGGEVDEAAIYLRILLACIQGRVGSTSDEMQIWASDLTKDYIAKYPLPPVGTVEG